MKKISIILLSVMTVFAMFAMPISANMAESTVEPGGVYLNDAADFLRNTDEEDLLEKMNEKAAETGWNIVILTEVGEYTENEARDILDKVYREKFGSSDGAGYIMTSEIDQPEGENDYATWISAYGDVKFQNSYIVEDVERPFLDYNEHGSAKKFIDNCVQYVPPPPYKLDPWRFFYPGIFFGGIPAVICIIVVIARYKSHPKVSATRYLNLNDTRFWRREDTFVREFTTRVPVNTSSGGGGGRSGGGGSFGGGSSGRR
jgi:uncharacterized membrane protein YgcG